MSMIYNIRDVSSAYCDLNERAQNAEKSGGCVLMAADCLLLPERGMWS